MSTLQRVTTSARQALLWGALLTTVSFPALAAGQDVATLAPLTKLRLTVVQFVAATGDYKRWDALGGDLDVAADGTVTVPTLGAIPVGNLDTQQLGAEIATRLKTKLGLLDAPDASVQVISYPPVYVVGTVTNPGEFAYRPGMTVVQAMALAGGERQAETASGLSETIRLESDLDGYGKEMLRTTARLARLRSEFAREPAISFPPQLDAGDPVTAELMEQERRIFAAHNNGFARQETGLTQLAELFNAQIDALGQKSAALDEQIARAQQQVDTVTTLVAAGTATTSRLTDAERVLADLKSSKLDNLIATMTAQESLNRTQRDLAKLQDDQQSDASIALQEGQAALEKLQLNQTAAMRMLRQSVEFDATSTLARTAQINLTYSILRQQDGAPVAMAATEATPLLPGDLVKVSMRMEQPGTGAVTVGALAP